MEPTTHTSARALIDRSLVWDNHTCLPLRPGDYSFLPQLERCRQAGIDVVSINVGGGPQELVQNLRMLASFRHWFSQHSDRYLLVGAAGDIDRARREGKMAIVFDLEGAAALNDGDHGMVQLFYDLGVRWMLLAYNRGNAAAGGCLDDEDTGLTAYGKTLLAEMKRVGMVVCCSHTGHRTALDVIAHAGNPVVFSHSNASAVQAHKRNIPDELIKACAATGGVVGINGIGVFLGENDDRPETLFRHLDHMVQLVGPEHVGLALDYVFDREELMQHLKSMASVFPPEPALVNQEPKWIAPEAIPSIVELMLAHGYADADVAAILGGNWHRVARQVWR